MKIVNRDEEETYISTTVETYSATISMTREVFNILVKGIYKNPYLAVVREYCCNAKDAQIEAGSNTPIQVHLPTEMEPWFSVKDSGLGMSKEMVTRTFMELGNSTKRERNDLVGAKGIGSKSAFSITDSFSVTSTYNGIKTAYSIFMNKGIPDIAVLFSNETTENNGVEVKMAVASENISSITKYAAEFFSLFDYPYEIQGADIKNNIKKPSVAFTYMHEDFKIDFVGVGFGISGKVIMGGVGYDSSTLNNQDRDFLVTVPIGAVDISPGREYTEEYDNKAFTEKLQKGCNLALEAYKEQLFLPLEDMKSIKDVATYTRKQTKLGVSMLVYHYERKYAWLKDTKFTCYSEETKYLRGQYVTVFKQRNRELLWSDILCGSGSVFMINDTKKHIRKRAKELMEYTVVEHVYGVNLDSPLLADKFFSDLAYCASTIVLPEDTPKERQPRKAPTRLKGHVVHVWTPNGYNKRRMTKDEFSSIKHHYIENKDSPAEHRWVSDRKLLSLYNVDEIYVLSERQAKWAKNSKMFTLKLTPEIKSRVKNNLLRKYGYVDKATKVNNLYSIMSQEKPYKVPKNIDKSDVPNSVWNIFSDQIEKMSEDIENTIKTMENIYEQSRKKLLDKAPLLKYIPEDHWSKSEAKNYVKLLGGVNV